MSDSKYSNFDYDLSQKILTLLKVSVSFGLMLRSGVMVCFESITRFECPTWGEADGGGGGD